MQSEIKFSVVIPTRNREDSLRNLLQKIFDQTFLPNEIIIVDSSDERQSSYINVNKSIKYLHTNVKSAAVQRNIGMYSVKNDTQVLFFLDDDTSPASTYFEDMLSTLLTMKAVGVSGLAINPKKNQRIKPSGIIGFIKKISFLDSSIDGKVLISGIGIPVRKKNTGCIQVEWLIGCSCWDFQKIKKLKFEEDFRGHSLGEDVIFSVKASMLGKLFVNTNLILEHIEFQGSNHKIIQHNYMWVYYRFRLSKYIGKKILFYLSFYLSIL